MKDSYVFYASFDEALRELPDKSRLKVYDAVSDYALRGIEPEFNGMEKAIFTLIKAQIDRRNQRVENGKKGGRKKQVSLNDTQSEVEPYLNHTSSILKPHLNQNSSEVELYFEQKEKVSPMEKESTKEKGITLERDKYIQESKKESYINKTNKAGVCTHEELMQEWGLSKIVSDALKEFLRHCCVNKQIVSNERLNDILVRLFDKYGSDEAGKVECIWAAIRGGYFDVKA